MDEYDIIDVLNEAGVSTSLVSSAVNLGGGLCEIAFETLEVEFNHDEILDSIITAGFDIDDVIYESPSDRGVNNGPQDVIPFLYVTIEL